MFVTIGAPRPVPKTSSSSRTTGPTREAPASEPRASRGQAPRIGPRRARSVSRLRVDAQGPQRERLEIRVGSSSRGASASTRARSPIAASPSRCVAIELRKYVSTDAPRADRVTTRPHRGRHAEGRAGCAACRARSRSRSSCAPRRSARGGVLPARPRGGRARARRQRGSVRSERTASRGSRPRRLLPDAGVGSQSSSRREARRAPGSPTPCSRWCGESSRVNSSWKLHNAAHRRIGRGDCRRERARVDVRLVIRIVDFATSEMRRRAPRVPPSSRPRRMRSARARRSRRNGRRIAELFGDSARLAASSGDCRKPNSSGRSVPSRGPCCAAAQARARPIQPSTRLASGATPHIPARIRV